jgi:ketosteroid isomerase-like protein
MTPTDLSPHINAYFELMDTRDTARIVEVFTPDAVVHDDGHSYQGHDAIRNWITGPASEYSTTATWISARQSSARAEAAILLEGDFPGGRVELHYTFEQAVDGLITDLTIAP